MIALKDADHHRVALFSHKNILWIIVLVARFVLCSRIRDDTL